MNIMSKECYYQLAPDLTICRIVNGMWQVAGGHGYIDYELAIEDMIRYHEAGFTSWDLADIYGPAEDFIGEFRRKLLALKGKEEELNRIQALTKWVPQPVRITRIYNYLKTVLLFLHQALFVNQVLQQYSVF
jgi:aryl-alcohol dehydrogenase-like predicted oxidoreductase